MSYEHPTLSPPDIDKPVDGDDLSNFSKGTGSTSGGIWEQVYFISLSQRLLIDAEIKRLGKRQT